MKVNCFSCQHKSNCWSRGSGGFRLCVWKKHMSKWRKLLNQREWAGKLHLWQQIFRILLSNWWVSIMYDPNTSYVISTYEILNHMSCTSKFFLIYLDKCSINNINICKNGGKCIVGENGNVTCMCNVLHSGRRCEISKTVNFVLKIM